MATYNWISKESDLWSDPLAWSGGPNPPPNDPTANVNIVGGVTDLGQNIWVSILSGQSFEAGSVTLAPEYDAYYGWEYPGLELDGTAALTVTGGFANSSTVTLDQSRYDGGARLTIGGTLTNDGFVQVGNSDLSMSAPTALTLGGLVNNGSMSIYGAPRVVGYELATLSFSAGGAGFTENAGTVDLWYVAPVTLNNDFSNDSAGKIELGGASVLTVNGAFSNGGTLSLDTNDTDGGGGLDIGGTLTNGGTVAVGNYDLGAETVLTLGGLVNESGAYFGVTGSPTQAATLTFNVFFGTGFTYNAGVFALDYVSPLTLYNDFTNESGGKFYVGGTSSLTVTGAFFNGGSLSLNNDLSGGGSPTIGGALYNYGSVEVGNYWASAATTLTLGGLVNNSGASFSMSGSTSHAATFAFSAGGTGFTANSGSFTLFDVAPLTLNNSFSNSGSFTLGETSALTVFGDFANDGGGVVTLNGASALSVDSAFDNGGTLEIDPNSGDGGSRLYVGGTLTNDGPVVVDNSALAVATTLLLGRIYNDSGASFSVYGSASHAATVDATDLTSNSGDLFLGAYAIFDVSGGYGSFSQTSIGTFDEAAGANFNISGFDTATLDGTTSLSGKVSGKGTLALAGGGATVIGPGAYLPVAHWSLSDPGTTVILNESMTYAGTFSAGAGTTLDLSSGNLALTGNDLFSGAATSGWRTLYAKGTATVSGLTVGGTTAFDNLGTLTESGGMTVGDAAGDAAKLINGSTGTWDLLGDSGISRGSSTSSYILNSGLFEKTGGTGTVSSAIVPRVVNSGKVLVTSGTPDFKGAVSGTGTDTISGASILEFGSTVSSSATVGSQNVGFTGGGTLVLTKPTGFYGEISGFAPTDVVELLGSWRLSNFSENAGGTLGTLTLTNGSTQHAFNFVGDYTASEFNIASGATTTFITHAISQ